MKHLDLFSGIGGFALASEWAFGEVEHVFCDNEPFAQAVLHKHWPNSKIYGDIRSLTADTEGERFREERKSKQRSSSQTSGKNTESFDLLTGGFPCQPFSQAGQRRGTNDDRYLWPEMLRVIREFHPRWVIGENVGGLVTWSDGMVLEQVHTDLESEGYEVQAFIIPAVSLNAPHRRDRVWIVGHSKTLRAERHKRTITTEGKHGSTDRMEYDKLQALWDQNWHEVATRLCRVDDGVPRRMDRTPRLKALGNAIVPQIAYQIMLAIKEVDKQDPT